MRRLLAMFTGFLAVTIVSGASAAVPSAANSHLDPCMVFCPGGDMTFNVIVRDLANNPVVSSTVIIDFSACPLYAHCPDPGTGITADDVGRTLRKTSDGTGLASFKAWVGGICPGTSVRVFADGVLLGAKSLASPDQDGNLLVDQADFVAIQNGIGTTDATKDLDCSGDVTANDVTIATSHRGHSCLGPVPTRQQTWGTLKLLYR